MKPLPKAVTSKGGWALWTAPRSLLDAMTKRDAGRTPECLCPENLPKAPPGRKLATKGDGGQHE
jgi:hypothetical protein